MKVGYLTALGLVAAVAMVTAGAGAAGASPQGKTLAKSDCKLTLHQAEGTFASYITELKVKNTSCKKGLKVVDDFQTCRKEHGGKQGHCNATVDGYKCNEGKRTSVPGVQFSARVVCKNGAKKVVHSYTMNL
jgi:hypothetical protein